jgi:hypothetical protein
MNPNAMISAYYFRAHQYTYVPDQVARDMDWMAAHGTDAVVVGILEQDLFAAVENVRGICEAAAERGMRTFMTPSRWGGLVAGCPKVPSIFSATRPDALARDREGRPRIGWLGGYASVHHPDTLRFFQDSLRKAFDLWPLSGVIWDEPKGLNVKDFSDGATQAFLRNGWDPDDPLAHEQAAVSFFDQVSLPVKAENPGAHFGLFTFGFDSAERAARLAALTCLDTFGCDGRPWPRGQGSTDSGGAENAIKSLLDDGPRFVRAARDAGKDPLFLIENHAVSRSDQTLMERYLPQVLEQDIGHLIYYYYPRSCEDPDAAMHIIGRALRTLRLP